MRLQMAIFVMVLLSQSAIAEDQQVSATVQLQGFTNSNISTGIRSTDVIAPYHSCQTGDKSGCTVTEGYSSIPKNIGNVLCLPESMNAKITSACDSLLRAGEDEGCKKNEAVSFCGGNRIYPVCSYRTKDDKSVSANWTWVLTPGTGVVNVDCKQTGYQGYTQ